MTVDSIPAAPKRPPAPRAKSAKSAAVNTAFSATTGARPGAPAATTKPTIAPARTTPAISIQQIAPATAPPLASRWEPALPAAGNTMEIITLTVTGQAMTRSTGIPVSMGTVQKERTRLNITSFMALWTHALSPRPPASPRPCTMKTARAASSRERTLIHTRITAQTRPTTTSSATQPKPPPAPRSAGMPMKPARARGAATPPTRKSPPPAIA